MDAVFYSWVFDGLEEGHEYALSARMACQAERGGKQDVKWRLGRHGLFDEFGPGSLTQYATLQKYGICRGGKLAIQKVDRSLTTCWTLCMHPLALTRPASKAPPCVSLLCHT